MRGILFLLFIFIVCSACGEKQYDLTVKGRVKGLKKGTLYLKKASDSIIISVDSLEINGNSEFELHSDLESPEVFFLYLDKNSNDDDKIQFFADNGITEINTTLQNFAFDAKINGSKQQKTLEEYLDIISRFNNSNLDLIKENFEAKISGDTLKLDSIQKVHGNFIKRKYLYTVNFAINNKDSEVAPYLALTEIYDAKVKLLDTINNSLTPKVKASKYGKELQAYIENIKADTK